jgi:hypothetical protein
MQSEESPGTVTQLDEDGEPESTQPPGAEDTMTDTGPQISDFKRNLLSFASATTGQVLRSIWEDGSSLYGVARNVVVRAAHGATYSMAGAALGAVSGFLIGPTSHRHESEQERMVNTVNRLQTVREAIPMIQSTLQSLEYDTRKKLEEMGYYPCEACGTPHLKDEAHQMPAGTYWSEAHNRYVKPDDADWTKQGYESAAGERWEYADEDEDDGGEQIH